jgi:hypothetical protein
MLTVTNKAASLLKVAKTAEGAPRDAGIRLRLDSGLKIQASRSCTCWCDGAMQHERNDDAEVHRRGRKELSWRYVGLRGLPRLQMDNSHTQ